MFTDLQLRVPTCACLARLPSGAPAAPELRESSAGGPPLQRGLPAGSDRANRAAEDRNSAAAVAPAALGQSLSLLPPSIVSLTFTALMYVEIPAKRRTQCMPQVLFTT